MRSSGHSTGWRAEKQGLVSRSGHSPQETFLNTRSAGGSGLISYSPRLVLRAVRILAVVMTPDLSAAERWVLEQLADGDHHFANLGWLGGDEYHPEGAIEVLQSLLARGYVEARQCYEGDSWSRLLSADEAKDGWRTGRTGPASPPLVRTGTKDRCRSLDLQRCGVQASARTATAISRSHRGHCP
jgi:hypothetical protein